MSRSTFHRDFNLCKALLLAGLIGVVIAVLTISYQSIRAALINPVDNLRNE